MTRSIRSVVIVELVTVPNNSRSRELTGPVYLVCNTSEGNLSHITMPFFYKVIFI